MNDLRLAVRNYCIAAGVVVIMFFPRAAPTKPNETLIFASNRTGSYNIWSRNLATDELVNLTSSSANNMNPQVSPDGRKVVFYSDRGGGLPQIFSFDLKSPSKVTQLTDTQEGNYDPVFSWNGRYVFFKRTDAVGNFGHLWRMDPDGSHQTDLTPSIPATYEVWKPAPVTATSLILTIRTRQKDPDSDTLYRLDTMTGRLTQLTHSNLPNWFPAINPSRSQIAFISKAAQDGHDEIDVMNMTTTNRHRVNQTTGADFDDPSWTPDNKAIVCLTSQSQGEGYEVVLMDLHGHTTLLDHSPKGQDLSPIIIKNH